MPITKQKIIAGDHWEIDGYKVDRHDMKLTYYSNLYPDAASASDPSLAIDSRVDELFLSDLPPARVVDIRELKNVLLIDLQSKLGGGIIVTE